MHKSFAFAASAAFLALASPAAAASLLTVDSYSMPNGGSGTYHYWDETYDGSGSTTTNGAALSGGTGDLTDGVVAASTWNNTEPPAGAGPYVGWLWGRPNQSNPTITFDFGSSVTLDTLRIHVDNSAIGGVYAPTTVRLNGVSYSFTAPRIGTAGWIEIGGLSDVGQVHALQLFQRPGLWAMVSEVEFYGIGAGAVPEPATWAMLILGMGAVGGAMRRRRARCVRHAMA